MPTLTAMPPLRQRGIVLMVALVMLVTITLLAIMTLGTATTEQRIAATDQFRNMGFQGAESAIEGAMTDLTHLSTALLSPTPVESHRESGHHVGHRHRPDDLPRRCSNILATVSMDLPPTTS